MTYIHCFSCSKGHGHGESSVAGAGKASKQDSSGCQAPAEPAATCGFCRGLGFASSQSMASCQPRPRLPEIHLVNAGALLFFTIIATAYDRPAHKENGIPRR